MTTPDPEPISTQILGLGTQYYFEQHPKEFILSLP